MNSVRAEATSVLFLPLAQSPPRRRCPVNIRRANEGTRCCSSRLGTSCASVIEDRSVSGAGVEPEVSSSGPLQGGESDSLLISMGSQYGTVVTPLFRAPRDINTPYRSFTLESLGGSSELSAHHLQ